MNHPLEIPPSKRCKYNIFCSQKYLSYVLLKIKWFNFLLQKMSNNLSFENILIEKMSNNLSDGNFPGGRLQFMGGTEKKCVGEPRWHGLNFQYLYFLYSVFAGCVNQLKLETLEKLTRTLSCFLTSTDR